LIKSRELSLKMEIR